MQRRSKCLSAGEFDLTAVGIQFHLSEQRAADGVAGERADGEKAAGDANTASHRETEDMDFSVMGSTGPAFQRGIPGIAFTGHASEAVVDGTNEVAGAEADALAEMTEFVRHHTGEFAGIESSEKGKAQRQTEVGDKETREAAAISCRGVGPAIDLDLGGFGRSKRVANHVHEREQQGLRVSWEREGGPSA